MKATLVLWFVVVLIDLVVAAWFWRLWWLALAAGVLSIIGLGVVLVRRRRRREIRTESGWSLGAALEISNPDVPAFVPEAVIPSPVLKLGMLALGAPGAGKTESVLLGYLQALPEHSPGSGCAVFEGKGDIDIYKKCVAMGSVPDYFFSTELAGSHTINLMEGESHEVVDRMTRLLIGHTDSTSYYSDAQRAVLSCVIPLLSGLNVPINLRDLYTALAIPDAGLELLVRARDAGVDPTMVLLAEQWYGQKPATRLGEIRGLLNKLFIFCHGPHADRLNAYQPDIRVNDVVANNRFVYFHLPLSAFTRDVAIAIVEMFGVEARRRQLAGPEQYTMFPLLMDDWGGFFYEGFGPFSARCRSAGMPLSFSFQSLAQVKAISQTFADELDDNLATKIILRVQGEDTGQFALRLLGEYDALEVSTSLLGDRDGTSLGTVRRARLQPRDLRELMPGEAYISTLYQANDRMVNPLWRVRLPRLDFDHWQAVAMPIARIHEEGRGLGLWRRYMDPTTLATLKRETAVMDNDVDVAPRVVEL
ncbi:MAG: Uncharacterized protein FD165_2667 [Gammaproteobacteria bacterium]|nr:MAG: Uncharacterized protein FD165_2667 [Gammaproteobacteria bacterium]TND01140.1 MAG: Uncharacterized protein FD120_2676 [Gammaproteobacteria bacterium]